MQNYQNQWDCSKHFVPMAGSTWMLRFWRDYLVLRSKGLPVKVWSYWCVVVSWTNTAFPPLHSLAAICHKLSGFYTHPFPWHEGKLCRWQSEDKLSRKNLLGSELKTWFLMDFFQIEKFLFPWCSRFGMRTDRPVTCWSCDDRAEEILAVWGESPVYPQKSVLLWFFLLPP